MTKSPAFQYYPDDMANDPQVQLWDMVQLGCYHQMLDYLWINGGKCEENIEIFRRIFRKNHKKISIKYWNNIKSKFKIENGIITHKRITKELQRQLDNRLRRSNAGKKGMAQRWGSDNNVTNVLLTKNNSSTTTTTTTPINTHTQSNFTLDDVIDTGKLMGVPPDKAEEFYHHFNAQGWQRANGQRITNLQSAMVYWRNHQSEFLKTKEGSHGRTAKTKKKPLTEIAYGGAENLVCE